MRSERREALEYVDRCNVGIEDTEGGDLLRRSKGHFCRLGPADIHHHGGELSAGHPFRQHGIQPQGGMVIRHDYPFTHAIDKHR